MIQLHEIYLLGIRNFDIKPQNTILDVYGNVYVVDMGSCEKNDIVANNQKFQPGHTEIYSSKYNYLKKHY